MPCITKVTKIEVSALFWRDLSSWRNHASYFAVRAKIAEMVLRAARGEPAGDAPFSGRKALWAGIGHAHVGNKLTLFTMRPEDDTLRLCALKKHDFYGFRSERRSQAETAALKIRNAADGPSEPSPGWSALKWRDPSEIPGHPELRELSHDGLRGLYAEILRESETFERLARQARELSPRMRSVLERAWLAGLIEAQSAIEIEILRMAQPVRPHVDPEVFADWSGPL